jgi:hypothetical protein
MLGRRISHWETGKAAVEADEAKSEDRPDTIDRPRADGGKVSDLSLLLKGKGATALLGTNDAT